MLMSEVDAGSGAIKQAAIRGAWAACLAAARSAFAFALIILARAFSVYALWSKTPSETRLATVRWSTK